jgi:hypothetical protein
MTALNVLYDRGTENEPVTEIEENFSMFVEVRMLLHDAQRVQGLGGLAVLSHTFASCLLAFLYVTS